MLDKTQLDFLRTLCETQTPSGREIEGQRLVAKYVDGFADEITLDGLGNLHAVKNPGAPFRVMIDAHCDENGLMVQFVDDKGFLFFSPVGGVNRQLLPGERVSLMGPKGNVPGVIGRKPIHLMSQREKDSGVGEIDELWIDIGARDKAEALEVAPPGTFGTADAPFRLLCGSRASARAFDDRCGVFVIMEALRRLKGRPLAVAAHFVSTTQEELGLLGSKVAAFGIDPNLGLSVDVTFATDDPQGNPRRTADLRLGGGPVMGVGPNYDPAFSEIVKGTAAASGIPLQLHPRKGNGNDAFAIRHTRAGVPVVHLAIPLRYMHSSVETLDLDDLDRCAQLIADVLASLPAQPEVGFRL